MAQVPLTPADRRTLIALIAEWADVATSLDRVNLLERANLHTEDVGVLGQLNIDAARDAFCAQLVRELQRRGTLDTNGLPALVPLLLELREIVRGHEDEAAFIDRLLVPYRPAGQATASAAPSTRRLKLFVSYRRKSWPAASRLKEALALHVDADIFMDFQNLDATDFEVGILRHLRASDAVLVVVSEYTFSERIHAPDDWVRREIALALELSKPIVLVLMDGRTPPPAEELPDEIRAITRRQGIEFYPAYWDAAVVRLAGFIGEVTNVPSVEALTAPATAEPAAALQPTPTLADAVAAFGGGDFERVIFICEAFLATDTGPGTKAIRQLLQRAEDGRTARLQLAEARREYAIVCQLAADELTRDIALSAWHDFRAAYPNFDEDVEDFATRFRATPEQDRLWRAMIDLTQSREDRAEAGRQLSEIGDPRPGVGLRPDGLPDIVWCDVAAGSVDIEGGVGPQTMGAFKIARYPITYAQYKAFLDAPDGYGREAWWTTAPKLAQREPKPGEQEWPIGNHPAERVSWYDAMAFCRWLTARLRSELPPGTAIRLPTEGEWQLAAGGPDGWVYPWGEAYFEGAANVVDGAAGARLAELARQGDWDQYRKVFWDEATPGLKRTTAVGVFPQGAARCGAEDMSGNVWEWTMSEYGGGKIDNVTNARPRVVRGGSWYDSHDAARAGYRDLNGPGYRSFNVGFRVVLAAPVP